LICEEHFLKSRRSWDHYLTEVWPSFEFSKLQDIKLMAANASRRHVNTFNRLAPNGLESLSNGSLSYLPRFLTLERRE